MKFVGFLGPFLLAALSAGIVLGAEEGQFGTPKGSEGTRIFKGGEHPNYTGQFRISGQHAVSGANSSQGRRYQDRRGAVCPPHR
jgi:hypothetical protein